MTDAHTEEVQRAARKKRVQRLKKIIVITVITAILFPTVLCVFLFIKTARLERQIDELKQSILSENDKTAQADNLLTDQTTQMPEKGQNEPETQESVSAKASKEETQQRRNIYLTFDDGPSSYTSEILDILKEYDVKATFFVVGREGEKYEKLYKRIAEEGHTIGMHSYSHKYSEIYESKERFVEDFNKLHAYLYDVTGVDSRFYRFPGGSSNTVSTVEMGTFIDYLEEENIVYFDWNISSGDASSGGLRVEQIVDNCTENVENYNNAVILLHDSKEKQTTVEALPLVIEKLLALDNTQIVPITDTTEPVQHRKK